jgi:hypothetical protein
MADIPERHMGVPRTHRTAKALGYKSARIKFDDVRANFIQFADHGSRDGSVCGVAPDTDPRYWAVCYKDESGVCKWVRVPRAQPQGHG